MGSSTLYSQCRESTKNYRLCLQENKKYSLEGRKRNGKIKGLGKLFPDGSLTDYFKEHF